MIDLTHLVDELASDDGGDRDAMVSRLASGPKSRRRELIHADFYYIEADDPELLPGSEASNVRIQNSAEVQVAAAIEIQRVFRGHLSRCRTLYLVTAVNDGSNAVGTEQPNTAATTGMKAGEPVIAQPPKTLTRRNTAIGIMETEFRKKFIHTENVDFSHQEITDFRKEIADFPHKEISVTVRQQNEPSEKPHGDHHVDPREKPPQVLVKNHITPFMAALIIQRAWRRHIDVQVFRYYRDLINFKDKGDPALMLKCINPIESKLLDAAAGVHIKFRLAGHQFPPNIYYKIFTHRPVQDLCANSPKDYTQACHKKKMARYVHNKTDILLPQEDTNGWYRRHENNGWRLVSDRFMQTYLNDQTTYVTSMKKAPFLHNKLLRREEVERKKKQKKIDWMRKMYKKGMLKAKVDDSETIGLINGAAAGMLATVDVLGVDAVQNWEVDELLDWTTGLNFDDYWSGWKELATSAKSDKPVEEKMSASRKDSFELTGSASHTRSPASTRQSHNTPVSNQSVTSIPY